MSRAFETPASTRSVPSPDEAHYRLLYLEAPLAFVFFDADGRIEQVNRAFLELSQYDEGEIVGRSFTILAPEEPEARTRFRQLHLDALASDRLAFELPGRRKSGERRWIRGTLRTIRDDAGAVRGFNAVCWDVSDLKRAEQDLRGREALYHDLYENAPLSYMTFGTDAVVHGWNAAARVITGIARDEDLQGKHVFDFLVDSAANREAFARMGREVFVEGRTMTAEVEGRRPDGTHYWARCWVGPVRDAGGRITGGRSISVDVTELKRAEEALRESETRLAAVIDAAFDAILVFDRDTRIVLFNPAAERMFRCPAAEAIGTIVTRFTSDQARASFERAAELLLTTEQRHTYAEPGLRARRRDDEEFEFEASLSRVQLGSEPLLIMILRDVEERRRRQDEHLRLLEQAAYLQEEIKTTHNFDEIVGQSAALSAVLRQADLVAHTDSTVLILGESGTGKELVARAIHARSARKDHPLVKVNCAALPTGLIESELFGHEKGAFTGAVERRIGRFELAHRGTLFLDEVGELPLDLQAKLLRVLQEQELERVGGQQTVRVDVRLIAATNRDLAAMTAAGTFRQDLYYRLNVFPVRLPALRDRRDDVPPLAHYFVRRYAAKIGRRVTDIPPDVLRRLVAYDWPGNVRELENVVERAVILSRGPALEVGEHVLPASGVDAAPAPPVPANAPSRIEPAAPADDGASLEAVERRHIVAVLDATGWRIEGPNGAAKALELSPSTLRSRMQRLGIRRSAGR